MVAPIGSGKQFVGLLVIAEGVVDELHGDAGIAHHLACFALALLPARVAILLALLQDQQLRVCLQRLVLSTTQISQSER